MTQQWPGEWMRSALGLCVLRSMEPEATYGYAIANSLEAAGFGAVKGGTLYPLLTRFEAAGWVTTEWRTGEGGPGRKYFSLTTVGREELQRQSTQWCDFTDTIRTHLDERPDAI